MRKRARRKKKEPVTIGFGQYRDTPLDQVPVEYIEKTIDWLKRGAGKPHMKAWEPELPRMEAILKYRLNVQ